MKSKVLVLVNYQYDYTNPDGTVYVNGSDALEDNIIRAIKKSDWVICVMDWHTPLHKSFIPNEGRLKPHCLQDKQGSAFSSAIADAFDNKVYFYEVGGNDYDLDTTPFKDGDEKTRIITENFFSDKNIDYYVCGVDFEDSVKNTITRIDELKHDDSKIYVLDDCVVYKNTDKFMKFAEEANKDPHADAEHKTEEDTEQPRETPNKPEFKPLFEFFNVDIMTDHASYVLIPSSPMYASNARIYSDILSKMNVYGYIDDSDENIGIKLKRAEFRDIKCVGFINKDNGLIDARIYTYNPTTYKEVGSVVPGVFARISRETID